MKKILSFVLVLCLVAGCLPLSVGASPLRYAASYTDVPKNAWYADAVGYAKVFGLMNGTDSQHFNPSGVTNRAMIVTVLYRMFDSPATGSAPGFSDVAASAWYADAVTWAVENNITNGMGAGTFKPLNSCTRAQIVTFLWRAAGQPEPASTNNPFTDVSTGDYFYKPVLWAVENEITNGTTKSTFAPLGTCSRAQAATFLMRFRDNVIVARAQQENGTKVLPIDANSFAEYDRDGRMTQVFYSSFWGNPYWHVQTVKDYDAAGNCVKDRYYIGVYGGYGESDFVHGSYRVRYPGYLKTEYFYDEKGMVVRLIEYSSGDPFFEDEEAYYTSDRARERTVTYQEDGNVLRVYGPLSLNSAIDTKKYRTIEEYGDTDGVYELVSRENYRPDGQISSIMDGDYDTTALYEYDAGGRLTAETSYSYSYSYEEETERKYMSQAERQEYLYNSAGQLEKLTVYDDMDGKREAQGSYTYHYNQNGSLSRVDWANAGAEETWTTIQVQYDTEGRLALGQYY